MRRSGFTLVELVMVAAVIAVISAVAIPRYSASMSTFRARTAARRVAADITMAQSRARAASQSKSVQFSATGYTVSGIAGLDGAATYSVRLADDPYRATIEAKLGGSATTLTFDGYGWPDRGGTIVVTSGSCTLQVVVEATTGVARVQ